MQVIQFRMTYLRVKIMKLRNIASNMTELELSDGTTVLFSYKTPVAGFDPAHPDGVKGHFKTSTHYSPTTTRHINKYFSGEWNVDAKTEVREVSQEFINGLVT